MPIQLSSPKRDEALALLKAGKYLEGCFKLFELWTPDGDTIAEAIFTSTSTSPHPLPVITVKEAEIQFLKNNIQMNPGDAFKLALCYLAGIGVPQSDNEAEALFLALSKEGYAPAQNALGWMQGAGRAGLEMRPEKRAKKAIKLHRQAADGGYALGQVNLALSYTQGKSDEEMTQEDMHIKAKQLFHKAIEAKFAPGYLHLAILYHDKDSEPEPSHSEREEKAPELYLQAANLGNILAIRMLGFCYQEGRVGLEMKPAERDKKAADLYLQAASMGDASALNNLAYLYEVGRAGLEEMTKRDRELHAIKLYQQAIDRGEAAALTNLGRMYKSGRVGLKMSHKERVEKAAELYLQAATMGDIDAQLQAQYNLACLYAKEWESLGISPEESLIKRSELLKLAAGAGDADSQNDLGELYNNGKIDPGMSQKERREKAAELYLKSARAGNSKAQINLAILYLKNGTDLGMNQAELDLKSVQLFKQAANKGSTLAKHNLAWMYVEGRADLDISQEERELRAIQLFQEVFEAGVGKSAINLAYLYKKRGCVELSLKFFSLAANLLGDKSAQFPKAIDGIKSFSKSQIRNYALSRALASNRGDISKRCEALMAFTQPSDYLWFFEEDIKTLRNNETYRSSLIEKMAFFSNTTDYETTHCFPLVSLILKIMLAYLTNTKEEILPVEVQLDRVAPYFEMIMETKLHRFLPIYNNLQEDISQLASTLLTALMPLEKISNRETILFFVKFFATIDKSSTFWQNKANTNNLIRLFCSLFTHGAYMMPQINCPDFSHEHLNALLTLAMLPKSSLEGISPADEIGLSLISRQLGVILIDIDFIHQQIKDLFTKVSSSFSIGFIGRDYVPLSPRRNPLLNYVQIISQSKASHEVLIGLLKIQNIMADMPADKDEELFKACYALLASTIGAPCSFPHEVAEEKVCSSYHF